MIVDGIEYITQRPKHGDVMTCIIPDDAPGRNPELKTKFGDKGLLELDWDRVTFPNGESFVYWANEFAKLTPVEGSTPPLTEELKDLQVKLGLIVEEKLPCPFCGGRPTLKEQGKRPKDGEMKQTYQVCCTNCDMTDRYWSKDTSTEAIRHWNKRA